MAFRLQLFSKRGDTIIEVMIAIAIISTVLAGAFSVTQKSALAVRDSQERSEMLQLLQGQVELVRSLAVTSRDAGGIYDNPGKFFCIKSSGPTKIDSFPADFAIGQYDRYPSECITDNRYHMAINYSVTKDAFIFSGDWDRIGGGDDKMQLSYRIPQQTALSNPDELGDGGGGDDDDDDDPGGVLTEFQTDQDIKPGNGGGDDDKPFCWQQKGWNDPSCWNVNVTNISNNDVGAIDHCTWEWDVTKVGNEVKPIESFPGTADQCKKGVKFSHNFTPWGIPPTQLKFTVRLTNYPKVGKPESYTRTPPIWRPY